MGSQFEGIQSTVAGKSWWRQLETAAHIAATARRQRVMNATVQSLCHVYAA